MDTNAFSNLFRTDSARESELRRDLRASSRSGRFRYLTSGWTVEELAGLAAHADRKYRRIVRFAFELVGDNLIEDPPSLVEAELRLGRRLRSAERMVPRAQLMDYRGAALDLDIARQVSEQTRHENRAAKAELAAMRERVWERLAPMSKGDPKAKGDPRAATLVWFGEAERWIEEWSRHHLAGVLAGTGRDRASAARYPLERVPTVVNIVAAMIARIAWNTGHGRRIEEGDNIDTRHYVAACYADIFVSDDRRLAEVIDLVPRPEVRPISLSDFARDHLGWRRSR